LKSPSENPVGHFENCLNANAIVTHQMVFGNVLQQRKLHPETGNLTVPACNWQFNWSVAFGNVAAIVEKNFKTSFPATGYAHRRKAVSTPSVSSLNASFQKADDTTGHFNCQGSASLHLSTDPMDTSDLIQIPILALPPTILVRKWKEAGDHQDPRLLVVFQLGNAVLRLPLHHCRTRLPVPRDTDLQNDAVGR